jgi:hypothetical protein
MNNIEWDDSTEKICENKTKWRHIFRIFSPSGGEHHGVDDHMDGRNLQESLPKNFEIFYISSFIAN